MYLKYKIALLIIFIFFIPNKIYAKSKSEIHEAIKESVLENEGESEDIELFVDEYYGLKLIKNNRVFKISSADVIPFKTWYVVLDESDNPLLLSYKRSREFNNFIKKEALKLKKKKDFLNFLKVFIILATSNETILGKSSLYDKTRIKEEHKNLKLSPQIAKGKKGIYRLTFFTINSTGSIKMWQVFIDNKGLIDKVLEKTITLL